VPTIADLLLVEVQVNTGNSAQSVEGVNKQLQGTDTIAKQASSSTDSLSKAFGIHNTSAVQLAGSLLGVNIGLSAVASVGREVHAVISDVVNTSIKFGGTMAEVGAVSGASAVQLARLGALARTGGVDIGIGGNEAARGLAELIKGGVSTEAALGGALRATELMAQAGGVDLAQAAEISAVALNSFGLSAAQLPHVADLVAAAANASSIDVNDFRQSLTQAGAVARTIGVSFDDTSVAIAELGQAGLKGSDAGTSLRTFLLRLTPESKEAEAAMRSLGITTADGGNKFFDASGHAKSLSQISEVLRTALAGYTDQQKLATLQTIFGSDAVRAASIFAREGASGFTELQVAMAKIGADDVAHQRLNSLAGDMQKLASETERLKIALGDVLTTGARPATQAATPAVGAAAGFVESGGVQSVGADVLLGLATAAAPGVGINPVALQALLGRFGVRPSNPLNGQPAGLDQLIQQNIIDPGLENERAGFVTGADASRRLTEQTNAALKPARDLRAELDALGQSAKGGAQGINVLESATAGLRLAGEGDIEAVASLRAEAALRLREQAVGERAHSSQFRERLVIETTDQGASAQDRAKASGTARLLRPGDRSADEACAD
jgi:TP901 family phage tail tape measure protein